MAKKSLDTQVQIEDVAIPLRVYVESRNNVRISIGKKHVILRLPRGLSNRDIEKNMDWAEQWLRKEYHGSELLKNRFSIKQYVDGETIRIQDQLFTIHIEQVDARSHSGKIIGTDIYLKLNHSEPPRSLQKATKHLLSRLISHHFIDWITTKVHHFNDVYFQKEIRSVRLKYNKSNWGSCSNKNNINLSSRLLFAPEVVIDYVIIHELAHLIEMNHSARFWSIVSNVMPSYKEKEAWLKKNGSQCDF